MIKQMIQSETNILNNVKRTLRRETLIVRGKTRARHKNLKTGRFNKKPKLKEPDLVKKS